MKSKARGSKIGGSKALGSWRDLSSGFAGEVEDWFVGSWREVEGSWVEGSGSKINGSKALALGRRLWVRGVIWALGSPVKSKIGLWVRGAKALGRRRSRRLWVADDGLSLLPLSLSLSVFFGK